MIILICNSNMFVPVVLTTILENPTNKYLVMSDTVNIIKFFSQINIPNVSLYEYKTGAYLKVREEKRKMLSYCINKNIESITFYHAEFGELINWFILKKAKEGVVIYYCKIYDSIPFPHAKWYKSIKIIARQLLFFNYIPDVLCNGSFKFPSIPDSFFNKTKAKRISSHINFELIDTTIGNLIASIGVSGKYLLLSGSNVADGMVSESDYTSIIDNIIDIVGEKNIAMKCHPRYKDIFGKERVLKEIPSYIPGNLIINQFDTIIGYQSTMLVEAAVAGKKAISLLFMIPPVEARTQESLKAFFQNRLEGKGEIFFPKTIEEFKTII